MLQTTSLARKATQSFGADCWQVKDWDTPSVPRSLAALLLAADAGDLDAEQALLERDRADAGLHPGATIVQASPFGDELIPITLG